MRHQPFGLTGLNMPLVTLGSMRFMQAWQDQDFSEINSESQNKVAATLEHALDLGINHFETARGYGTSEMQMGKVLPRFDRGRYILQSKVAPTKDNQEFAQRAQTSFAYLGVDYIDLFSLHGLNNETLAAQALQKGGALDQALTLQKQGRIGHIGFTSHAPPPLILKLI